MPGMSAQLSWSGGAKREVRKGIEKIAVTMVSFVRFYFSRHAPRVTRFGFLCSSS